MSEEISKKNASPSPPPPPAIPSKMNKNEEPSLIETAVRFMQNPKVKPTSSSSKRMFLTKKGLTESDITEVFKRAGINESDEEEFSSSSPVAKTKIVKKTTAAPVESFWSRILRWIKNILLAGAISYTAFELVIRRYLFGDQQANRSKKELAAKSSSANEQETAKLTASVEEMRKTLNALRDTIETVNSLVSQINLMKNSTAFSGSGDENGAIKNEIQSIKSLLLSRTQFPTLPTIEPIIPTWQLEQKKSPKVAKKDEEHEENESSSTEEKEDNYNQETKKLEATKENTALDE